MKYDFETFIDRSQSGSSKWLGMLAKTGEPKPNVVPMSTADMEFMMAPEIIEGLQKYIGSVIQGYTRPTQAYFDAVLGWQKRRHGYEGKQEWIVTTSGVVPAIFMLVNILTEPGDGVIIQRPVYYPFSLAARVSGRRLVNNNLIEKEDTYEIDFADLEEKAKDPRNKVLVFCSPHNPVGKVWSREDLERVVQICLENHVFIIDDEIHNDLIMPGQHHIALPTISRDASRICAYCTAPSKTFNLAGMQLSNIFVENAEIRGKMEIAKMMMANISQVGISYEACRLAYDQGEAWLEQLLEVIQSNADFMKTFLAQHIPQARCYPLCGTYLQWVDFRGLGLTHVELERLMLAADLYLDEGPLFGSSGRGFERFNLAMPQFLLRAAMERLVKAWNALQEDWKVHGRPQHVTLEPGMDMPDFSYDSPFAAGLNFRQECAGKPTVLFFQRYYTCGVCQRSMGQLAKEYGKITDLGGQVKVVLQSTPDSVRESMGGSNVFPFEIVCDPDRKLYELLNVFPADSMYDLPGDHFRDMLPTVGAMFSGTSKKPEGLQTQLPAWFVVDGAGRVCYAHYCTDLFDAPDADAMAAVLKTLKK